MSSDGLFGPTSLTYKREGVRPHSSRDLTLAPVAVEIDENLRRIRDKVPAEIAFELVLETNRVDEGVDRTGRASIILDFALKDTNLHGWTASITADAARVHLEGGSVTIDLGLSASITDYIENGASAEAAL
jgi:hypothetical protein